MDRRAIVFVVLLLNAALAGCRGWTAVDDAEDLPADARVVRVVTEEGTRLTLEDVSLRHDTLYSQARWCSWTLAYGRAPGRAWCGGVAIAREDVVRTEVPAGSAIARNVLIVALGFVAGALVIGVLELVSDGASALRPDRSQDLRRGSSPAGAPQGRGVPGKQGTD
jgi:hypothetical protein